MIHKISPTEGQPFKKNLLHLSKNLLHLSLTQCYLRLCWILSRSLGNKWNKRKRPTFCTLFSFFFPKLEKLDDRHFHTLQEENGKVPPLQT